MLIRSGMVMVLGKLVFRGERKNFFLYGENKKKKKLAMRKPKKKKKKELEGWLM